MTLVAAAACAADLPTEPPVPGLALSKRPVQAVVTAPAEFGFVIDVSNPGTGPITGVQVVDTLPSDVDGEWTVDRQECAVLPSGILSCALDTLDATQVVSIQVTSFASTFSCTLFSSRAHATADTLGPATDSATVSVQCPDDQPDGVPAGRTQVTERPFGVDVSALGAVYIARLDSDVARGTVPLDSLDGTIAVGSTPRDVAFSPDGATAYVTNEFSSSVSVVDASTHATVDQVTVTGSPFRVKVNSAGDRVYVSGNADSVFVIDPSVPAVIAAVGVDLDPNGMALSPDDGFLYVSSNSGTSIVEIATATNAIARTFPLGEVRSQDLAVSADGATLYVAMETSGRIRVIDLATGIEGAPIPLAGAAPFGLALAPSGAQLYVTGGLGSGSVHVIDVATGASRAIFLGGQPRRVAFGPDGSFAFVTNEVGWVDVMR